MLLRARTFFFFFFFTIISIAYLNGINIKEKSFIQFSILFFFTSVEENQTEFSKQTEGVKDTPIEGDTNQTTTDLYDPLEVGMDDSPAVDPSTTVADTGVANTGTSKCEQEERNLDGGGDVVKNNEEEKPSPAATPERSESPIFPLVNKTESSAIFPDDAASGDNGEDDAGSSAAVPINNVVEKPLSKEDLEIVQESQNNDDEMEVLDNVGSSPTSATEIPAETPGKDFADEEEMTEQPVVAGDQHQKRDGDDKDVLVSASVDDAVEEENLDERSPSP